MTPLSELLTVIAVVLPVQRVEVVGDIVDVVDGAEHAITTPALAVLSQFDPFVIVAVRVPPA